MEDFGAEELIFCRCHPAGVYRRNDGSTTDPIPVLDENGQINREHIRTPEQSVYRSAFCEAPTDVLYDEGAGAYQAGWGVFQFRYGDVAGFSPPHPDAKIAAYTTFEVRIEHEPTACAYPHSDVRVYKRDTKAKTHGMPNNLPRTIKSAVQERISRVSQVVQDHNPDWINAQNPPAPPA